MDEIITREQAIQEISDKLGRTLDEAKAVYEKVYDLIEATLKGSATVMGEHAKIAAVVSTMQMNELPTFIFTKTCAHYKAYFLEVQL